MSSIKSIDVFSLQGRVVDKLEISESLFDGKVNLDLLHRIVYMQQCRARAGTHSTKNISEVSGSGRKFMKQKGSGRARHHTRRSVIFRGGATALGVKPRDYSIKMNKKMLKEGLKSALIHQYKNNMLFVVDSFAIDTHKTAFWRKECVAWHSSNCLLIGDKEESKNLFLSTRNVDYCNFLLPEGLNVYQLLKGSTVLISKTAFEKIQRRLS